MDDKLTLIDHFVFQSATCLWWYLYLDLNRMLTLNPNISQQAYWNPFSSFQKITKKASQLFENYLEQGTSKCLIALHVPCSKSDTSCASWQLIKKKNSMKNRGLPSRNKPYAK